MSIRLWSLATTPCKFFLVTPEQDGETTEGEKISPENLEQHNNRLQFTPAFQMLSVYLGLEQHKFVFRILDVMESWKCRLYFSVYGIKKKKKDLIEGVENGCQVPVLYIQHMQEIKNFVF